MKLALHWQILIAVVLATITGTILNATISKREVTETFNDGKSAKILDSTNKIDIKIYEDKSYKKIKAGKTGKMVFDKLRISEPRANLVATAGTQPLIPGAGPLGSVGPTLAAANLTYPQLIKEAIVDPTGQIDGSFTTISLLEEKDAGIVKTFHKYGRSPARQIGDFAAYLGGLFLRLLKMVSIPLVISSLLTGVLGLADAGRLRKLFGYTILYYVSTSMLAIFTGLLLVNFIQPGEIKNKDMKEAAGKQVSGDLGDVLTNQVENMIPTNPMGAVADSEFLSIIAFSLAFGVFTILVGGHPLKVFRDFFESAFQVMMKMTMAIIHLAPYGVFCLMLYATATQGLAVFQTLGWYMLTVFSALAAHALITLPLIVWLVGRRNPLSFAHAMSPALMTAFSSASSNATLPLTLSSVEKRAGIDNRVGSFVLPLGATINMDGTALFEVIAVLFIAQLEPDVSLSLTEQIIVAFTALLASIGAAGIPHAGLVMMVIVLSAVGLPADRVGLILAVDRILDMCRTSVNVWSDSCGCAVIARLDGGNGSAPPLDMNASDGPVLASGS